MMLVEGTYDMEDGKSLLHMRGQGLSVDLTLYLDNFVTFDENITIMT